ncbi:MAG: hypothetical protein MMC33_003270 [Icmadophila ericetorum]|nr:hypothetical protein [Icmadophila ericetorum]
MSTPHRGLGLPPPSAMTLQNSDRGPHSLSQSVNQLPPPTNQWQHSDESLRWQARAEEERRIQEEQRTQQEHLKLEQRKIERDILRESLQGGVPPYLVPVVFAGMAGGHNTQLSLELAQHYMSQFTLQNTPHQYQQQHQQQQQQQQQAQQLQAQQAAQQQQQLSMQPSQTSPEARRDSRMISGPQPNPYGGQQLPVPQNHSGQQLQPHVTSNTVFTPSFQAPVVPAERLRAQQQQQPQQTALPISAARPQSSSTLPLLNTGEMQIQAPPSNQPPVQHHLPAHSAQQQEQQPSSSPSTIYFHHWVPPVSQAGSKDPQTPSGRSQHESPYSQNASSHLRSEYANSPKKRKATGTHHPTPAPSNPGETSPSFSHNTSSGRRRAHSGQRSDASSRGAQEALGQSSGQNENRLRQHSTSEAENGSQRQASTQPETRQSRNSAGPESRRTDSGTPKREPEGPS